MLQTSSKTITLKEFLTLPETKPASEYINGQIVQKPMRKGEHSAIQGELTAAINATLKSPKIARAFPELRCTFGGRSIVPDVSVFTYERIPRKQNGGIANVFKIAPDWTIEILSPGQNQTKVTTNILHCLNNGTQLGWLIDPAVQIVLVYFPQQQPASFEAAKDPLPVPQFANTFKLTVGNLFNWLY
jgi:Uma2 family endonuclease